MCCSWQQGQSVLVTCRGVDESDVGVSHPSHLNQESKKRLMTHRGLKGGRGWPLEQLGKGFRARSVVMGGLEDGFWTRILHTGRAFVAGINCCSRGERPRLSYQLLCVGRRDKGGVRLKVSEVKQKNADSNCLLQVQL
uniref:Uncharacterized protein n=1 Tax=Molossus molossus TaxID=27622 RepID=A0A7J8I935_MOLMO|nr:hypothetical protein HJG59_010630 [Molossus molossus]